MDAFKFHEATEHVMEVISEANRYVQITKPWTLKQHPEQLQTILYYATEALRIGGILLQIVMPDKMGQLLTSMGIPMNERQWKDTTLRQKEYQLQGPATRLFKRE
jgi:methionyl-tRNA synthetase